MKEYMRIVAAIRKSVHLSFLIAVVSVLLLSMAVPSVVGALTTDKITARSNQSGGNAVIGGQPTRVTWEGTVTAGEQISFVQLDLPEGTRVNDDSRVEVTILDGLERVKAIQTSEISDEKATVSFSEPVPENMILRIELYNISLPEKAGEYELTGSFKTAEGNLQELERAPQPIVVAEMTTVETIIMWLNQQEWVNAWNSVPFFRIFLNPQMAVTAIPLLFIGWLRSFALVMAGFPLAIPIGLGVSFLRMSKIKLVRFISGIFVNVIRGTPLFLQIYIAFFGLPAMGIKISDYLLGILVLAMNSSAYLAEIFRAGIQSISKGQFEAANSLGMNGIQTMFYVIIPQTVRRVIPTATSEFILLYKDTSLLAAVGVMEMMMFGKSLVANTGNMTPYVIAAGYYLLVTMPLTRVISTFEKKLALSEGRDH
ncbi:MAG: amino acid ABC transporter permease [Coriobacteriia bacterium]|nr:amino acid ABC transporter permease [Coriobacteriia bacterium]